MKSVVLERDGVINQNFGGAIGSPTEWIPIPGSLEAIAALNQSGYRVVVACTQHGVTQGELDIDRINAIHRKMHQDLESIGGHLDGVLFCPHRPSDDCGCRHPKTGLLNEISGRFGIALAGIPVIGHSRDVIESALSLEASPILVTNGAGKIDPMTFGAGQEIPTYTDLKAAVEAVLELTS